jgi:hypothetical protein
MVDEIRGRWYTEGDLSSWNTERGGETDDAFLTLDRAREEEALCPEFSLAFHSLTRVSERKG